MSRTNRKAETATNTAPAIDIDAILAATAAPATKKKASGTPNVSSMVRPTEPGEKPDRAVARCEKVVSEFLAAHRRLTDADAEKKAAAKTVLDFAGPARIAAMETAGFLSSVKLNGEPDDDGNRPTVTVTWTNAYSALPAEPKMVAALQELTGNNYPRWFQQNLSLTVRPTLAADEAIVRELIEKLGPERFVQIFESKRTISTTDTYHEERPRVIPESTRAALDALMKPQAPSVKAS